MVTVRKKQHNQAKGKTAIGSVAAFTRSMRVADVTALLPDAAKLMAEYGIQCAGCSLAGSETLEEGCRLHGFTEEDITELVSDLNSLLDGLPPRPPVLTITRSAAKALERVAGEEGKKPLLLVTVDGRGGFCMEFMEGAADGLHTFRHADNPEVLIAASDLTLRRTGGATIDYREGRFKLDLAE
ncbi:MAG: hypothetical protein WCV62_04725 [Candidatus Peribacteraceae bacterium]|jgi:hybrid cluster-associated redox disulfide protein